MRDVYTLFCVILRNQACFYKSGDDDDGKYNHVKDRQAAHIRKWFKFWQNVKKIIKKVMTNKTIR